MAYENERAERDFRQNPPESAPGQNLDDDGWGDLAIGSSSAESLPTGSSSLNSPLNSENFNGGNSAQPLSGQPQQATSQLEDKIFDVVVLACKGIFKYFKALATSLQNNTQSDWHDLGVRVTKVSVGCFSVGLLFSFAKIFIHSKGEPLDLVIGSLMSLFVGISLCMFCDKDPNSACKKTIEEDFSVTSSDDDDALGFSDEDSEVDFPYESDSDVYYEDDVEDEEVDDSVWDSILSGDNSIFDDDDSVNSGSSIENGSVEDALSSVPEIQAGTQTRSFLFESFMKVLPKFTPDFSEMREISSESDDFYYFEEMVRNAASQVGTKDECLPELLSVYENDFIYRLNCDRPVGIKEQLIADEVASTFSRDANNMEIRVGVYATVETSTNMYTINLFKGTPKESAGKSTVRISLGDIYNTISSFICDTSKQMPFVWGVNEYGKPVYCDLISNNSLIISGEPRGGKSWKGQSIVAQLCMFNSPKEVEFYIFDCKNMASDYRYPASVLPHIRYFCGDPEKVNDGIDRILKKVTTERDKILSDAGCINIKDYNEKNPMNKLSYIYIVVDEMMSLMDYFSLNNMKDESNRFKGYLSTMVSKLPYTGVRFILFPHRIVDSVIAKNTYSLVSSRAVVCQSNPDDLKSALDVTQKTFPYSLVSPGDMAIRTKDVEGGKVIFCHAEMLTSNNEGNKKLFEFIGSLWRRLEPEYECIKVNPNSAVCGSITINGKADNGKGHSEPKDNTKGSMSYKYSGYSVSTEDLGGVNSVLESIQDLPELDEDKDEDFWNSFME